MVAVETNVTQGKSPATLSVRFLQPFFRAVDGDPRALRLLMAEGIALSDLVAPEARIAKGTAMRLLSGLVHVLGDPQIGLKAGCNVQHGDMGVLEFAAGSCGTLREASECFMRYHRIVHDAASIELLEKDGVAVWRYYLLDTFEEIPAAHDFAVAYVKSFVRLLTGRDEPPIALHFAHRDRTNLLAYRRIFACPVQFGLAYTGCVFPAEWLDWPMLTAARDLHMLFERQARETLRGLEQDTSTSSLVRRALLAGLPSGRVGMAEVARQLGVSASTLRRRLQAEGTTHTQLLEETRRSRALELLARSDLTTSEISFLLNFSDPPAFYRAFRRWTGRTPSEYRNASRC